MRLVNRRTFATSVCVLSVALMGCGEVPRKSVSPSLLAETSTDELTVVKRAEFENWNRFPVGTAVTRVREIVSGSDKIKQTTVYTLASKSDTTIVVESRVSIERNGQLEQNEPTLLEYGATFRLPVGMEAESFALPDPNAKLAGSEKLEVDGKTYDAQIYSWLGRAEAGPVEHKIWVSDDFPGRSLRHQTHCADTTTQETVMQLNIPVQTPVADGRY